ncbi:uncharacterized protein LOC124616695 [Schistocerca americana]|uniref:uncharacterized protein LOC124616695 n=1 Tax=Schistocerca americana TaxID=7009 RepID=UPI001F500E44|nr:uncharacterized protein LOC124616695 [Schistocerca americana]
MLEDGRLCGFSGTSLLVLLVLFCLQPAGVACRMKCSASGLCPGSYLCCHNQHCCLPSERIAEIAGATGGVILLLGGVAFCCIQCCRTRRQDASNPVLRLPAVVPTPTPSTGGDGDLCTETSPLSHDHRVTYGSHQDISSTSSRLSKS